MNIIDGPNNDKNNRAGNHHFFYKIADLQLQGRFFLLDVFEAGANFSQLGLASNGADGGNGQSASHSRTTVDEIVCFALVFVNGHGFTREDGFVDRKIIGMYNDPIRGDQGTFFYHQAVANDQFFTFDFRYFAIPNHFTIGLGESF